MLLKGLEAYGFKSFADKLEVEFDQGITAIVGPNGSGKSNITDAIRWVLGEQNVRNLRGTKAEDIIFTGSSTRRALGMAEVSLTFDNSDRTLPLDFEEIMITRRIYRTGESEFFINKAKCRLKDIFNLFADTGLGKNSMSVISQNKVDEVLNTKPEERRYFFEECAGITKFRDRKREAKRKLDTTGQNILRLRDIFGELEKQIQPLALQAEKTTRFNEINHVYKACKITKLLHSYEELKAEEQEQLQAIADFQKEKMALETTVNVSEADKIQKQQNIHKLELSLKDLGAKLNKFNEETQHYLNRSTMLEERIKQTIQAQQRVAEQIQENKENYQLTAGDLAEAKRKVELAGKTADALTAQLAALNKDKAKIEGEIAEAEAALKAEQNLAGAKLEEIAAKQQEIMNLQRSRADVEASIVAEQENHRYLVQEQIEKHSQQEIVAGLIADLAKEKDEELKELSSQQGKLEQLQAQQEKLNRELQNLNQVVRATEEKVKLYEAMQQAYEGFGKATKKVLKAKESWSKGVCGAVAELIKVDEEFVTAIDVALGNAMQNIVVQDTETAKAAIKYLRDNRFGRVTFMPLTTVQPHSGRREEFEPGRNGFMAYADELVSIDPEYRVITQSLLGRILVVDCIDNALKLAKIHKYRLRIVTLKGELIHPGGSLAGGSTNTKESGFLQRSGELAELKAGLKEARGEQSILKKESLACGEKAEILAGRVNELQRSLQNLELQYSQKVFEGRQIELWFEQQQQRMDNINKHIAALKVKQISVEEMVEQEQAAMAALEEELQAKKVDHLEVDERIHQLREDLKMAMAKAIQKEISTSQAQQEVLHFQDKVQLLTSQGERYAKTLEDLNKQAADCQTIIDDSLAETEAIQEANVNLVDLAKTTQKEHDKIYQRLIGLREELEEMAKERAKIAGQSSAIKDKIHKRELTLTKLQTELKQLVEELNKDYNLTPDMALQEKLEITKEDLAKKLKALAKEMAEIGPVNPNAIAEYEALKERHSFMAGQIEDLLKAKEDLEELIKQIDKTMTEQFKTAFQAIQISFNTIFRKLFGGGKGELILTDKDDMLNTGIEIQVEPPDKKPLSMASLSGGERTLTVIALLFAFFSYNPAPFSVLDEIDAPLDEANVKRFAKFLKDFAKDTQFILVTHRKGTMEAANTLYGVTIEDAGVSKLISVRLDDFKERE